MKRTLLFILALGAFLLLAAVLAGAAWSHSWYDGQCCNEVDCRQTILAEVERRDNGWYVVSTKELIPFDDPRIKRSLDPLIHICVRNDKMTRCLYVPEVAG